MLLAIDIGNTNIVFGVSTNNQWVKIWRIQTQVAKTADEYKVIFRALFQGAKIETTSVNKIIFSSVVPFLNLTFNEMVEKIFNIPPIILSTEIYGKIKLKILNPSQIGADIVANAFAANQRYKGDNIVLDLGTALTLTTVKSSGEISGVSIAPGIITALNSLSTSTAQLPTVDIEIPSSILGKNTKHAIQAGVILGYKGMIRYMVKEIKNELNSSNVNVIATGGFCNKIAPMVGCIDYIEPNLTLDGLRFIAEAVD